MIAGLDGVESLVREITTGGVYVGITHDASNPSDFVYGGFIGRDGAAQRLNFSNFPETRGFEINDEGWITGVWETANALRRGYVARINLVTGAQEIHDLGLYPGYDLTTAFAINNDRTIVGGAQRLGEDYDLALIWPEGQLTPLDLNPMVLDLPAGVKLIDAYRINNAGQILAEGRGPDGFSYYRLDPVVPEPAGAVGMLSLLLLTRLRAR